MTNFDNKYKPMFDIFEVESFDRFHSFTKSTESCYY